MMIPRPASAVSFAALLFVAACGKPQADASASADARTPGPWTTVVGAEPFPSPSLWPNYRALDYKTANPRVGAAEAAHIRRILARVKPCQRSIVYYAYPSNADAAEPVVVYFKGPANSWPHVLGAGNEYYKEIEGEVFPMPPAGYELSLAADIRNEPCEAALTATPKPPPTRSPIPFLWPSYRALDYATVRPSLSAPEANQVANILQGVRECQRPYVRYAFPIDRDGSVKFVVFFQSPHDDWPHVLGQADLYFKKDQGTTFAMSYAGRPPDFSLAADVRSHPCPGENGPVGATVLGPN